MLNIKNLTVEYHMKDETLIGVDKLSLSIKKGETLGIIGESGSGKTSTAMAIMGLIKEPCKVKGEILFEDNNINTMSKKELNEIRWSKIAIAFQNSLDALNPLLTIHNQIYEVIDEHSKLREGAINKKIDSLLIQVGLDTDLASCYPHELSGGMRQRVLLAMALACEPELLIVDEPTSSLDMLTKNEIIKLISKLYKENNFALLVISHELDTILKLTSNIAVMYSGSIVEKGLTKEVIENPKHTYTKGLLSSSPAINPFGDMWGIPSERKVFKNSGCPFQNRCNQSIDICKKLKPSLEDISNKGQVACNRGGIVTILKGESISKTYKCRKRNILACNDCNIEIKSGEIVALIGQSGSGKSTLASIISGSLKPDKGKVLFEDKLVKGNNFTSQLNSIQMVFQDPFSSLNENLTIKDAVSEPLKIMKTLSSDLLKERVKEVLAQVQLPSETHFINRKCHSLSGGQRQRVSLARSLITNPKLLIADEISSMLDPSTQANILRLLKGLQNKKGFSMLYITHDLSVARKIADTVYVMSKGEIVEKGSVFDVFENPKTNYSKKLMEAIRPLF